MEGQKHKAAANDRGGCFDLAGHGCRNDRAVFSGNKAKPGNGKFSRYHDKARPRGHLTALYKYEQRGGH